METVQALIRGSVGFGDIHMEDIIIHQAYPGVSGYSDGGLCDSSLRLDSLSHFRFRIH